MYVLFETPAGYALFNILDEGKITSPTSVDDMFNNTSKLHKNIKLKSFENFKDTNEALKAATAIVESKLDKKLKKFLKKQLSDVESAKLAVCDKSLGAAIKNKLGIQCICDDSVIALMRGIRNNLSNLLGDVATEKDLQSMALGLSHSLSRYKLKFSPDKIDTMIVQAISLLDDIDKELNIYVMRVKEWYGWHFPELSKILRDNNAYIKTVLTLQNRNNAQTAPLTDVLPEDLANEVKEAAIVSMGTEISQDDILHISKLAEEVESITAYRAALFDYLKNRMQAIAPNLTHLVGELVGARLIAHAGSLMNLAKHPASTVQILGAEKAFFRALKSRHNTPKYGLLYHASLIGQAPQKYKGKIARVLAAKCAISSRVDAMGEKEQATIGIDSREAVEKRLRELEKYNNGSSAAFTKGQKQTDSTQQHRSKDHRGKVKGANAKYDESADASTQPKRKRDDFSNDKKEKKKKF
ncbi:hypothetical protein FDP41_011058 [Naegleria fowleri]|uniref:Nucleolar protein 58 n=1 Tax=Naegleria fowleri TaxID=5763 RepID=A0A6A5CBS1_NAEFO|nr:uncharacterized protein FDP41_011058 [Naegleria fowleri]KAF0983080.1 hypothetical protein FDP41_011058 [Naegleria fowleri]